MAARPDAGAALVDSHAHLASARFDEDREEVISRARCAGVTRIVTCGSDLASSAAEQALASGHEGLYAAVGVHGHEARTAVRASPADPATWALDEPTFAAIAALARRARVVAIGEIGLDYHYDLSPRDVQRAVLARQLVLAHDLDLPVILHNRESDEDLRAALEAGPPDLRGVLHCFLADRAMADWAVARGLYIGVGGPITFHSVRHLAQVVRAVPLERLLVETDSPYLAPHPYRGHRNEPAFVIHVVERLAEVLGIGTDALAAQTAANAERLFARIGAEG